MEIQIGHPLPTHEDTCKGLFDQINNHGFKPRKMSGCLDNKRSYEEAIKKIKKDYSSSSSSPNSLPLLVWTGQPNEGDDDDDDPEREKKRVSCSVNINIADEGKNEHAIVGWPPIKSWRRNRLHPNRGGHVFPNIRGTRHVDTRNMRTEAADHESLSCHRQRWKLAMC